MAFERRISSLIEGSSANERVERGHIGWLIEGHPRKEISPSLAQVFFALPEPGPGSYPVFWALLEALRTPVIRKYTKR